MKISAIALSAILGLATPTIAQMAVPSPVVAQSRLPIGTFQNAEWSVTLDYYNNALSYYGRNRRTDNDIYLSGASTGGNAQRRVYTWRNGNIRYQVAWQPSDPNVIRVQVIDGNGRTILNTLLYR
ncbi:hypothetical protein K4A83_08085 [Spirulina subsalsa FACHB-351]|uniref:Uncharacterized protein n=1 Tax=Spirulina subsalsa FACHB-351 TaxID=234711 RepID=A0ABT3L3Z8_9CYAN|nr:hypothetical protein [Spirulina subsalsa]MCW6036230.1 hypothetical protein [Spirulina subsalsa FACHB-351]